MAWVNEIISYIEHLIITYFKSLFDVANDLFLLIILIVYILLFFVIQYYLIKLYIWIGKTIIINVPFLNNYFQLKETPKKVEPQTIKPIQKKEEAQID